MLNKSGILKYKYLHIMTTREKEVVEYYLKGYSAKTISVNIQCNVKTVWAILKRNNIKARSLSEAAMKYTCNEEFFSNIDTEHKAYWLGALFADGNISKKASKSGQIFLTSADKDWVENFMKDIGSSNFPRKEVHKHFKTCVWKAQITSAKMFNDLNHIGCVPAKSKIIELPIIKNDLLNHFIRGYFDGDGTVGVYKNIKTLDWKILKSGICSGSKKFVEQLLEILPTKNKSIKYIGVYVAQFSLNDSLALYNYLYKDATVFLKRKKKVFDDYIQNYKPRKRFRDYNRLP
jgi:DNA-binding CsgD family transcriptional regulator